MTRVAGIGCRPGTPTWALRDALVAAEALAGRAEALATLPQRAPEVAPLAKALALPLHLVQVAGIATPTQSARVLAQFATGSVAEAAALAAAGPGAKLLALRCVSACGRATAAIAEGPRP